MAQALWWLFAAYLAGVTLFIVAENRRPSATFAWILLFATLPVAGVALYLLFGLNRRVGRARTLERQDVLGRIAPLLDSLGPQHEEALRLLEAEGGAGAAVARLVSRTSHSTVTLGNDVELLHDAARAYPRLLADLRGARASIHLQYFSWRSDAFGEALRGLLAAKAAEGVEVRVLYDPVGSLLMLGRRHLRAMRASGVDMRPFSRLWRVHTLSYRNHRKIAVVDGAVAHTGGLNIGGEHLRPPPGFDLWRDTNLRLAGPAASVLQAVFLVDWRNATGQDLFAPGRFPETTGDPGRGVPVQVTLSGPDSEWQAIRQTTFAIITGARRTLFLQSPFFILDVSIAEALKAAALKGVDVRVMISERGVSQRLPHWAAHTYMEEVARAGVTVLLYRPGYLHAKTVMADGALCSVGSANVDIRSFAINYELNALVYDAGVTRSLEEAFRADEGRCVPFTLEGYRARGPLLRLRDSVVRLASPLL